MRNPRLTAVALALAVLGLTSSPAEAKVSIKFANGLLKIDSGRKGDRAAVFCNGQGLVKVNNRDPRIGPVECSKVVEVNAVMRAGNDRVKFAGIDARFGQRQLPGFGQGTGAAAALGPGNDRLTGSAAAFNLGFGGGGRDRLSGGASRDLLQGGKDDDVIVGGGGGDVLVGGSGADRIAGGAGDDQLFGNADDDRLKGGPGADLLAGGLGMDRLFGGPGDDRLIGGPGKDKLKGGPGKNEVFQDGPK
jgi:Ca2+-binding RTX toxin-like protein